MLFTTRNKARSYTADLWIDGGASDIALDPDPNTVTLASLIAAGRVVYEPPGRFIKGPNIIFASLADGTSLSGVFWLYDDVEAIWIRIATPQAATTSGANTITTSYIADCKYYLQVTANTGVKKVAVTFR